MRQKQVSLTNRTTQIKLIMRASFSRCASFLDAIYYKGQRHNTRTVNNTRNEHSTCIENSARTEHKRSAENSQLLCTYRKQLTSASQRFPGNGHILDPSVLCGLCTI